MRGRLQRSFFLWAALKPFIATWGYALQLPGSSMIATGKDHWGETTMYGDLGIHSVSGRARGDRIEPDGCTEW
jgi:hypothetical protein